MLFLPKLLKMQIRLQFFLIGLLFISACKKEEGAGGTRHRRQANDPGDEQDRSRDRPDGRHRVAESPPEVGGGQRPKEAGHRRTARRGD